jgi:ElaB/YqjD/DUF883 family membrane-anchored ribosome-binding protein
MPAVRDLTAKPSFDVDTDAASAALARVKDGANTVTRDASEMATGMVESAGEFAENVSSKLKTVGLDTDLMVTAAKDRASELQRLFTEEVSNRPVRALGIAAAAGVVVGYLTARG